MEEIKNTYPVRNCDHEMKNDLVTVLFKKDKLSLFEKIFLKKQSKKPYKIDLDEIGTFVWNLCDGKKNVEEIIKIADDHFNEKINPAKERVELFIKQMQKNKLITLYEKK